jgi:hypothetical protein
MYAQRLARWASAAVFLFLSFEAASGQTATPPPGYFDIPNGFDFPADKSLLEQYRSQPNVPAQRIHVWNVFAGITSETSNGHCTTPTNKCSTFETWFSEDEAFAPTLTFLAERTVFPRFHLPKQFRASSLEEAKPQPPGTALLSFVLYNFAAFNHIRSNHLYQATALDSLLSSGSPDRAIPQDRMIPAFPAGAVVLKLVWWPVAKDKISAMPIWDPDSNPPMARGNDHTTWARYVGIDATRKSVPAGETADVTYGGQVKRNSHIVPLSAFHSIVLNDAQANDVNNGNNGVLADVPIQSFGRPVQAGDYAVLVATHLTTKEIDDWVWATFWWHDKPDESPFAANRVGSISGAWRNYLMNASFDLNLPSEVDGSAHVTFNPWLEAKFPDGGHGGGTVSNCMNCHNRASWPNRDVGLTGQQFLPIYRGNPALSADPAYASGRLRTDFLWSIPDSAQ